MSPTLYTAKNNGGSDNGDGDNRIGFGDIPSVKRVMDLTGN